MKVIAPAFYALGDARTPVLVSLATVAVNAVAAYTLSHYTALGYAGLALSASVVSTFSSITLLLLLRSRIGGVRGPETAVALVKTVAAAAVMGVTCYATIAVSHALASGPGMARDAADIVLGIPAGVASFYFAAAALKIPELAEARNAVMRKVGGAVTE
jgi:putative peptidoglycan lipid II flippase